MTDDEIRALLQRARETLAAADALPAIDPNSAASRAYYAAFYDVGDYGATMRVDKEAARECVAAARRIVNAVLAECSDISECD